MLTLDARRLRASGAIRANQQKPNQRRFTLVEQTFTDQSATTETGRSQPSVAPGVAHTKGDCRLVSAVGHGITAGALTIERQTRLR